MIVDKILLGLAVFFVIGVILAFFVFSFLVVWVAPMFPDSWIWRQRKDFLEDGNEEGAAMVLIASFATAVFAVYWMLIGAELLIRFLVSV